jgi:hypothetical protein
MAPGKSLKMGCLFDKCPQPFCGGREWQGDIMITQITCAQCHRMECRERLLDIQMADENAGLRDYILDKGCFWLSLRMCTEQMAR